MTTAYSYTRFSTPEQAQGDSARRQIELAELYATTHCLILDETLRLKDEGVSGFRGANVRKGALGQFLIAIDEGEVEPGSFLLVESLDRVSRQNPWDALPIFQQIINAGVTIVTLFDGKTYDLADMRANPLRIMESLFVMVRANEESETKSRRLKAAWEGKRRKAGDKPLTAVVPAWMRKDGDRIVLIPEKAEVVRQIVDMALAGVGQHRIADTLNRQGVPVFGNGQYWHRSYIKKIIENRALVGTFVPHEVSHEDGKRVRRPLDPVSEYFPAVVSEEEWAQLSGLAAGRKPLVKAKAKLLNILSGLATCAACGSPMLRVSKGGKSLPVLVCSNAKRGGGCHYRSIPMWSVEGSVRSSLPELADTYPTGDVQVDEIAMEVRDLETEVGLLVDEMIEHGRSPALTNARRNSEARLEDARQRLRAALEQSRVKMRLRPEVLYGLAEAPLEEVNTALRSLFKEVRIEVAEGGGSQWDWVRL
ncbi:MAG: recombinase family protein [Rhizobium sp.]|nr:recombinase family protein [Rhizobium sp.]